MSLKRDLRSVSLLPVEGVCRCYSAVLKSTLTLVSHIRFVEPSTPPSEKKVSPDYPGSGHPVTVIMGQSKDGVLSKDWAPQNVAAALPSPIDGTASATLCNVAERLHNGDRHHRLV